MAGFITKEFVQGYMSRMGFMKPLFDNEGYERSQAVCITKTYLCGLAHWCLVKKKMVIDKRKREWHVHPPPNVCNKGPKMRAT